jgi:ATP-binding cassette subfamily C (CFTR/MRP) protein 4
MGRWAQRPAEEQKDWDIVGTVIGLGVAVVVLALFRAMISFYLTIIASQKLHDEMTKAVLRAKIAFFDTNPLGRILNRFSADVGSNDDMLPQTLFDFLVILFMVVGTLFTTIVVLPFALLTMPPLIYYFFTVRRVFVTSTRELKRLEGLARSPIFAMLSESLSGIATIRANDSMKYFSAKFEDMHDAHTRAFFAFIGCSRWVGFRMDSLMFLLMSLVSFLSVIFQGQGWFEIDPAILGLAISMLLQLAGLFQWCIRQSAEVVNLMVSVERVLGFAQVEPEAPLELDSDRQLDKAWPAHGAVEVNNLAVRYRPGLPRALDGASFSIPSGSHVGVVGRTGSGKSTVVQTLFRLLESEEGTISIDGVDISKVGLHRLRTKISVIPQSPTLFSGCSVRENLDLFGIHSDDAIQKALKDAHMGEAMESLPKGFHSMVSEGGSNFSVGQRQLLCLARAILSKNKLLVLDEATASVDRRTDQMLHDSLHDSFAGATILAVAHRLDTVIDHDYILVLGSGKLLEFGAPADLIRSGGAFSKMVEDTGDTMSENLRHRALAKEKEGQDIVAEA